MARHALGRIIVAAATGSLLALAACSPVRFEIGVGPQKPLRESAVLGPAKAGAKVALIDLQGVIMPAAPRTIFGGAPNITEYVLERFDLAAKDSSVRAVVLRIDSPGGAVTTSDILYREIRRFSETTGKPVVASLGTIAASGGYYVALAADEIVAEPTSTTGSIGVIISLINVSEGLEKIGVYSTSITSGPNKDLGDPLAPPNPEHQQILQDLVNGFYANFTSIVRERRPKIPADQFGTVTDGRVMTGAAAAEVGLVDSTGTVRDAFARAQELAGISNASLVKYHYRGQDPATPWASVQAPPTTPMAVQHEVSMIDLTKASGRLGLMEPGVACYMWLP